jgi:hypothetical protein
VPKKPKTLRLLGKLLLFPIFNKPYDFTMYAYLLQLPGDHSNLNVSEIILFLGSEHSTHAGAGLHFI